MNFSVSRRTATVFACLIMAMPVIAADAPKPITVFAAASLTDALKEVSDAYTKSGGVPVRLSFAASSALARQIEAGAKADVFFSADTDWVDYLQQRSLLNPESRRDVLMNRLVLIAPSDTSVPLRIAPNFPIGAALGKSRLATGDPDSVPVGRYARNALSALGVWGDVADRVVRADNVRVALAYVARGEAKLGIVYETDALIEKKVKVVDVFPPSSHLPIVYPIAVTRGATPNANGYAAFVAGAEATAIFKKYGFTPK
jgi:molybdate transport system substrate-binding protein